MGRAWWVRGGLIALGDVGMDWSGRCSDHVFDWNCGEGGAGNQFIREFGAENSKIRKFENPG